MHGRTPLAPNTNDDAARITKLRSLVDRGLNDGAQSRLLTLLVLLAFAWLYLSHIDGWLIDDDEEGYLYAAWRVSQGEIPYRDFLTPQLPGFLYPGGSIVALFGRDAGALRSFTALLGLLAGLLAYATGRRLYGPVAGLAAMALLLANQDLFEVARSFRPEASMLAFAGLGVWLCVVAQDRAGERGGFDRRFIALASLAFGLALLTKLFGLFAWAAAGAHVLWRGLKDRRPLAEVLTGGALLALPGMTLVAIVMGMHYALGPDTYAAVLGHHLMQGSDLSRAETISKGLEFYLEMIERHAPLMALLPFGIWAALRIAPRRSGLLIWQLLTLLAFLFLSRRLFGRHLLYLLPMLSLMAAAAIQWLWDAVTQAPGISRRMASALTASIVMVLSLEHLFNDRNDHESREFGTAGLAALVSALTPPGSAILADYPGVGFFADRRTTYSGAALSEGATESGQITGALLLQEMAAEDVVLVDIDAIAQRGHLNDLQDFDAFRSQVESDFEYLGHFFRHHQIHSLYLRHDQSRLDVDFGLLRLLAAVVPDHQLETGDEGRLIVVFKAPAPTEKPLTAFLHAQDDLGRTWAQGDDLLRNAIQRSSEEWEPGELVAVSLPFRLPHGVPDGDYRLMLGLYDRDDGKRLAWQNPAGASSDAFEAATISLRQPARPPGRAGLSEGQSLAGRCGPVYLVEPVDLPETLRAGFEARVMTTWYVNRPWQDREVLALGMDEVSQSTKDYAQPITELTNLVQLDWPSGSGKRSGDFVSAELRIVPDPRHPGGRLPISAYFDMPNCATFGHVEVLPLERASPIERPAEPLDLAFGADRHIRLLGHEAPKAAPAGTDIELRLLWESTRRIERDLTTFVHLVPSGDPTGGIVSQTDTKPAGGARPTTSWIPGDLVADSMRLPIPAGLEAGRYRLVVGLYDPRDPDLGRLPAYRDGGRVEGDRIELGEIEIGPADALVQGHAAAQPSAASSP